jgi:hypothetical protein
LSTPPTKPSLSKMVGAFTRAEQFIFGGCILVIVSAFLTWKSYSGVGGVTGLHSWGLVTVLLALLALAYFLARSPFFRNLVTAPQLPVTDAAAYVLVGAAEIVTIFMFSSHYSGSTTGIGLYLAVIGAALTALGGFLILKGRDTPPKKPPATSSRGGVDLGDDDA